MRILGPYSKPARRIPLLMPESSLKARLKHLAMRALRPGLLETNNRLADTTVRLERLERHLREVETLARAAGRGRFGAWRGGIHGEAIDAAGHPVPELTVKYLDELTFWINFIKRDAQATMNVPFEQVYGGWQRERMNELREFLGLADQAALNAWCLARSAVEIGAGPYPSIATAQWKRAVAIDPLADGYLAEKLLPKDCFCEEVVYLASPGEAVPLPTGFADLVVIENCLDHVDNPRAVVREIKRLLKPGGHMWLLVDLMDYRDHMHPNPFSEAKLRELLSSEGFGVVRDRVSDHKSHPQAYAEYRGLLVNGPVLASSARELDQRPEIHVVASTAR